MKRLKDEKKGVDMEDRKRNPLCKALYVHQTRKRLVSASKRTWLLTLNFEYSCWIFILNLLFHRIKFQSIHFTAHVSPVIIQYHVDWWPNVSEKCKFGLFKGRSSKFSSTLAFPASFYKGLEEFEADLDPKQIEKLLVFFEVISTQEKISKVFRCFRKWRNFGKRWKIYILGGIDLYIMRSRRVFKLAGGSLRFMKIDWLAPRFE